MIPFGGTVLSTRSRGMCPVARVSDALDVKDFFAQFGLTLTSTCWIRSDLN
jgi:hypothetical protein